MAKKKKIRPQPIRLASKNEGSGTLIFRTDVAGLEGKVLTVSVNGKPYSGQFAGGQCWIKTGRPLGLTHTIEIIK